MAPYNRRRFLKHSFVGCVGGVSLISLPSYSMVNNISTETKLSELSLELLTEWCNSLIKYQVRDKSSLGLYGGILCPACARIHGRCSDAIYPLMYLTHRLGDQKYVNSAMLLFDWMEENVSLPNGSWLNDVNVSSWNGTTVFTAISIGEALMKHGDLLPEQVRAQWEKRLKRAAEYIYHTFHIEYSNVNYPITASYALLVLGKLFDEQNYKDKAKELAHQSMRFFTPKDNLLFGEGGGDRYTKSPKGCLPVDLGYNVEESLPALVLYALEANDNTILEQVTKSLSAHLEFILPDGAWDNSWGTRSFKWTYWGSRTSDGCQPAYALLSNNNPVFYKAALANTLLLKDCTHKGLLYGGPHYNSHEVLPCIHHTFCHAKALATILEHGFKDHSGVANINLPREKGYGIKAFTDIQTWLLSGTNWVATVVGYDREYKFKNGHPTGGALALLYHRKLGTVLASSMNHYQLIEAPNMQVQKDSCSTSLTARLQTRGGKYMNISDLKSSVVPKEQGGKIEIETKSSLVDAQQRIPEKGRINCTVSYGFYDNLVEIKVRHNAREEEVEFVFPLVSVGSEIVEKVSEYELIIQKKEGPLHVRADQKIEFMPVAEGKSRIFNHVPGMEALPLKFEGKTVNISLSTT